MCCSWRAWFLDEVGELSLALRVPLAGPQPVTLQGTVQLAGTELRLRPDLPPLLGARGSLQVEAGALALRGVPYRAVGAAQLLRDNLLIYGLGGLLVPFIGIKLIDMLLVALGLA